MLQKLKNILWRSHRSSSDIQNKPGLENQGSGDVSTQNIPVHVAIIMDGNGRWAKKRGLPRVAGHRAGMSAVKEITKAADEIGVRVLTLYAFSTENWKRPKEEVDYLMKLPQEFLATELEELVERNVQIRILGLEEGLPEHTLSALREGREKTKNNTGLILNFALNYGSRAEIVATVKEISKQVEQAALSSNQINEELISHYLQTKDLPDPDLLIRTKEIRLSNFMLWQLAYTELYFTDLFWPDFTKKHFMAAIAEYQRRARRFGSI